MLTRSPILRAAHYQLTSDLYQFPVVGEAVMVIPDMCGGHRRVRRKLVLSEDSGGQPTWSQTGWYSTSLTLHGVAQQAPPRRGLLRG